MYIDRVYISLVYPFLVLAAAFALVAIPLAHQASSMHSLGILAAISYALNCGLSSFLDRAPKGVRIPE